MSYARRLLGDQSAGAADDVVLRQHRPGDRGAGRYEGSVRAVIVQEGVVHHVQVCAGLLAPFLTIGQ